MDFGKLCAAYDVEHVVVRDWEHFVELASRLPMSGMRVLEVRTDRKADVITRRELLAVAGRAAGIALSS